MDFLATFDRVSHRGLFYKLRSVGVGGQFLYIVSEFLSDRKQRVRLDEKVSESVDVVLGVPQGCVLGPLLVILYTSERFHVVGNHIVGYATMYAVIREPLSRHQVMEFLNSDLAVSNCWCLKWRMKLTIKKTKSMEVSRSRTRIW